MYQIALNTAITNFKKTKRRIITQDLSEQHSVADFSENADTEERLKELYQAINQLNSIEKAIIMLYLEENTYQEIAKIMGITENNVGVKINRIKTKLKQLLDELLNC
jgi:RNA polymerase sigma-70 factor (ECF subfamily)